MLLTNKSLFKVITYSENEIKSITPKNLKIGYEVDVVFEDEPDGTYRYTEIDGKIVQYRLGIYYTDFSKLKHYEKPKGVDDF